MQQLKQIVHLIKGIKLKASDLISDQTSTTKVNTFYNSILAGDFTTDEEAAKYFYQSKPSNSSYKNLKASLRRRLLSTLFFLKEDQIDNERERAYLDCSKNIVAAKILVVLNVRRAGIELCHRVLKKALFYEFTDYILDASFFLRSHYATREGDLKKFEYYCDLLKKYIKIREIENTAGELYLRILMPYVNNKAIKTETNKLALDSYQELEPHLNDYDSPYLHYIAYYIESIIYTSINDYHKAVEVCEKALHFLDQKPYSYNSAIKAFLHQQVLSYTQLRIYEEGKKAVERSVALLRPGSYDWYTNLDLYLVLAFHSKKYQEVYYIFNRAVNHRKFKQLNPRIKERWQISEAYVHFLVFVNKIVPIQSDKRFSSFRLGKFLNSVPTFSKDKRGLNIPILVIQILLTIAKRDFETAINRIEAINKYCSRYLRKDQNFRSNCFIKMLLQAPISGFHKAGTVRRAEKYFDQLKSVPLEIANQAYEVEIIPYEDLWEIITNHLEAKFYKPRKTSQPTHPGPL